MSFLGQSLLGEMFVWWVVGGWFQGEFSVSFGPKSKFCSSDLDLDQAEQNCVVPTCHGSIPLNILEIIFATRIQ